MVFEEKSSTELWTLYDNCCEENNNGSYGKKCDILWEYIRKNEHNFNWKYQR